MLFSPTITGAFSQRFPLKNRDHVKRQIHVNHFRFE